MLPGLDLWGGREGWVSLRELFEVCACSVRLCVFLVAGVLAGSAVLREHLENRAGARERSSLPLPGAWSRPGLSKKVWLDSVGLGL